MDEDSRRRADIVAAKVAALKREREQKTEYFGEHAGISCDGCGLHAPLMGYRYRCKRCGNHDVCESCFAEWDGGNGKVRNALKQQRLSAKAADHLFVLHKDSKGFKPLVKGAVAAAAAVIKKQKPNDSCACSSGRKYKKCCGAAK
ncbi:hypothetical protein CTAYLR_000516 [Chrysophaeum taylorii]|uniref:ZZ-type domain-containing protein n=1 Tax=Chrysophaeum taylorii TaxID=2483200 RepID=A0AAD7UGX1_9STRA|nr:hypothetical protein CTAYLR_000516 [Chrysophaeum taylorii]